MKNKGFTLIELLVVIAIIAILASVVLISYPQVTNRARDARIISSISQMRTSMIAICQGENNCAALTCNNPLEMQVLCDDIGRNSPVGGAVTIRGRQNTNDQACIFAPLNTRFQGANTFYCTDMSGMAGTTVTNPNEAVNTFCGEGGNAPLTCPPFVVQ